MTNILATIALAMTIANPQPATTPMFIQHAEPTPKDIIYIAYDDVIRPNAESENYWTIPTQENAEKIAEKIAARRREKAVDAIAKTIYGEIGSGSEFEKMQVAWCICNRASDSRFPDSVPDVVSASGQFHGYSPSYPVTEANADVAADVYDRWLAEQNGKEVERELGPAYCWFSGDGRHNYFRTTA